MKLVRCDRCGKDVPGSAFRARLWQVPENAKQCIQLMTGSRKMVLKMDLCEECKNAVKKAMGGPE